tara:strand:+ start:651 stop:830 length:180 start_codon:yes stop_codon:yes gene_type:complete
MIPYTDEEMNWVNTGSYRKSNLNRSRKVKQEDARLWSRAWGIRTTIEVDGKEYTVPIQL